MILLLGCTQPIPPAPGGAPDDTSPPSDTAAEDPRSDRVLTVCEDGTAEFLDLPEAAEAAADGDTVILCPGHYHGAPDWGWASMFSLVGAGSGQTFIDPGEGPATFHEQGPKDLEADFDVRIVGVTIAPARQDWGGLIIANAGRCPVFVQDVEVTGMRIDSGGIAAMLIRSNAHVQLDSVYIHDNRSLEGHRGSPVVYIFASTAIVGRSVFEDNVITDDPLLWLNAGVASVRNSVFSHNDVHSQDDETRSGFVFLNTHDERSSGVWNSVFANNDADELIGHALHVENNIFLENTTEHALFFADEAEEHYNLFYGNNHRVGLGGGPEGVDATDLELDPMFTDEAASDLTLQPGSPAIDAGNPDAKYNDVDGTRNDIGRYGGSGGG